jgi:8-oxo-dGTP diphosphatase
MLIDTDTFKEGTEFHGVKGIVRIDDKIIVMRRDMNAPHLPLYIDLPGGGREGKESPFKALQREITEMLHILIVESDIVYAKRYENNDDRADDTFLLVTEILKIDEKKIVLGEKGLMYYTMTMHDFLEHPEGIEKQKMRIIHYLEDVKKTFA